MSWITLCVIYCTNSQSLFQIVFIWNTPRCTNPIFHERSIVRLCFSTLLPPSVKHRYNQTSLRISRKGALPGACETISIAQQVTALVYIRTLLISPSNFIYLQGIRWILLICGNIKNLCFPTCSNDTNINGYFSRVLVVFCCSKRGWKPYKSRH